MSGRYRTILLVLLSHSLAGCATLSYYGQAIGGQIWILTHRQSISRLVTDPDTNVDLKQHLRKFAEMRTFASQNLGLPDNASYKSYVDLERPYVVWNVFAAPEFSLEPKQWCYPVAGCVSYRGYFSEVDALTYAEQLRRKGFDSEVSGVSAFSTLGWFSDPLLNTMLSRSDMQLAGTLFHELAHQRLYVKNDTRFNESFAVTVELEGVRRWLKSRSNETLYGDYLHSLSRKNQFIALVQKARIKLLRIYRSDASATEKRSAKKKIFVQLKSDYHLLKKSWGNYHGYDSWFERKLTNASLVPISSYYDYVPAFQTLLQREHNDLERFYESAARLAKLPLDDRQLALRQLATN